MTSYIVEVNNLRRKKEIDNEFIRGLADSSVSLNKLIKLIEQGADINSISQKTGFICLMDALYTIPIHKDTYRADSNVINFLLDNGADINHCNADGFSTLHCAIWGHLDEDMVKLLLQRGAYPNYLFLIEGTALDIQSYYCFGGEYKEIEEATTQLLKNYNAKFSYELKTTQIDKYLHFELCSNPNMCFNSVLGYLDQDHIRGISTKELNNFIELYNELKQIEVIEVGSENYNRIVSFNQRILDISKRIKSHLAEDIVMHITLFDIFLKGNLCFGKNIKVDDETCLPIFICNDIELRSSTDPF